MKTRFTYTVLRYIHDVVTGEFANVGVVLYAPETKFLEARCVNTYGRLSAFFGLVDGDQFKLVLDHLQARVADVAERMFTRLRCLATRPRT